jgi:hypothetical protein
MARRATLDRDTSWPADDDALPRGPSPGPGRPAAPRPWRGSGGRWGVWVLRAIAWAVLLLIGYRGVTAIFEGQRTGGSGPPSTAHGTRFPVTLAQAYALNFGSVYLNYSPHTAARRESMLAAYLPSNLPSDSDPQLGWNGAGIQRLQSEQVASVDVRGPHSAVVYLLAQVNDKLIELGVPVYADRASMAVSGQRALVGAPARATPPQPAPGSTDQQVVTALQSQLPPFFSAYASGDRTTLGRFLVHGAQVPGLDGMVAFKSIQSITAPPGGATRHITVVVAWTIASAADSGHAPAVATSPASMLMSYRMTVVRQGTNWYVQSIGAAPPVAGPP